MSDGYVAIMATIDGQYDAARKRLATNPRYMEAIADPSIFSQNLAAIMVEVEIDRPHSQEAP